MKRGNSWWRIYLVCSLVILAAFGWVTSRFLGLELADRRARAESEVQSSLRLALWRIDSWLGPLLAVEAARPYTEYLAGTSTGGFEGSPKFLSVHFQVDSDGALSSPELGDETDVDGANGPYLIRVNDARVHVATVERILSGQEIEGCVVASEQTQQLLRQRVPESDLAMSMRNNPKRSPAAKSGYELSKRQGAVQRLAETQNQVANRYPGGTLGGDPAEGTTREIRVGTFLPLWFEAADDGDPRLMFVRRVAIDGENHFQGFLCSWPVLKAGMVEQVRDLFADCEIVPIFGSESAITAGGAGGSAGRSDPGSMLATIPASLIPPSRDVAGIGAISPTRIVLGFSWLAVLSGLVAVALAFRSTIAIAEKRARFAAAVTHELRTPLTTFRMYTDMLSQGMVTDPVQRDEYIDTLHDESERLSRLVENVLAYAQLEEGRRQSQVETITINALLERLSGPLLRRAESAGLEITFDAGASCDVSVQTDVDAVGQILFNLVDNACKYAGENSGKPLEIRCRDKEASLSLEVVDHGKGIAAGETAMVFAAFERGPLTVDRPGIGLGLALARGLARDLGGDLRLIPRARVGACFELTIPK